MQPSPWCSSTGKRCMDVLLGFSGLLVLSPLMLVIAVAIRFASGKPVLFRQWRTGQFGREFQILKFRTMAAQLSNNMGLTSAGDPRITGIGKWLRKWKFDELPQLVNVVRGEMSLVGPRPDMSRFWKQAPAESRQALALVPGLTGAASIVFRNEEELLAQIDPTELATFYAVKLLPVKARIDLAYAAQATVLSDCGLLLRTLTMPLRPYDCRPFDEELSQQ
jgi:lipopolysaccharide/colanic/teichoic acid biosynthesis glycosyltransferase